MRGNAHVRFGGRAEETDAPKSTHRASVRPDRPSQPRRTLIDERFRGRDYPVGMLVVVGSDGKLVDDGGVGDPVEVVDVPGWVVVVGPASMVVV